MALYLRPGTLREALDLLASHRDCVVLAGGTDHFPARAVQGRDETVLDIGRLPGLRRIERHGGNWFIPALATWSDALSADLPPAFDGLRQAARQVGGVQVQNAGTILGNLCNASPAADGVPALLALGASVVLESSSGRREVALDDFILGPRRTMRRADELAVGISVPDEGGRSCFEKLGARRYLVISIVMVAAWVRLEDGVVAAARVAVGACGPRATRLRGLEAAMIGRTPDAGLVVPSYFEGLAPIDDIRATAGYRLGAAVELTRRALARLGG